MGATIGIDLGVSSVRAAAVVGAHDAMPLFGGIGEGAMPAVVGFGPRGEALVGEGVPRDAPAVRGISRLLGRRAADVGGDFDGVVEGPRGDARVSIGGRAYAAQEIAAIVLREVVERAEAQLGEDVDQAVIAVPAHFNGAQRQAVIDAGRIAGLAVERLIDSTTAVVLADRPSSGSILAVTFDGVNADASVIDVEDGVFEVRATAGAELRAADPSPAARVGAVVHRALVDAGPVGVARIDRILLAGDAVRERLVRLAVGAQFEHAQRSAPPIGYGPDSATALGAAIVAGIVAGEVKDMLVLEVNSSSLGIESKGGVLTKVIDRNTTIPCVKSEVLSTAEDGQESIEMRLFQGEGATVADATLLGRFKLAGLAPAPRGIPQIEVSFAIDASGVPSVSARDLAGGRELPIEVADAVSLRDDEIERMRAAAPELAAPASGVAAAAPPVAADHSPAPSGATAPRGGSFAVFISYRRDESGGHTGRLFDKLEEHFGSDQVFMDVSGSLEPGVDYVDAIEDAIGSCRVLLVVIGKSWTTIADEDGVPRLRNPNDQLRLEVEAGLKRSDVRVIPVLVQGARMPGPQDVPETLRPLLRRQQVVLGDVGWRGDVAELISVIERLLAAQPA